MAFPAHRHAVGVALVLAGAECVWDDLSELETMIGARWTAGPIIVINDLGAIFPRPFQHWVSLHTERLREWVALRVANGLPGGMTLWGKHNPHRDSHLSYRFRPHRNGGSSGMLAVDVAEKGLGHSRVVLCGVPMDKRPHFRESVVHQAGAPWNSWNAHLNGWKRYREELVPIVRSMSGWTRETFGPPTLEWLGIAPRRIRARFDREGRRVFTETAPDPRFDVRTLGMTGSSRTRLARAGLTLDDATKLEDADLMSFAGIGATTLSEIRRTTP